MTGVGIIPAGANTAVGAAATAAAAASASAASASATAAAADAIVAGTFGPGKNLFNVATCYGADSYWDTFDAPGVLATYTASDLIPVTVGTQYSVNNCRTYQFRDVDGHYISRVNNPTLVPVTFVVPAGTAFVALNVKTVSKSLMQMEVGAACTTYEPYGVVVDDQIVPSVGAYLDTTVGELSTATTALKRRPSLTVFKNGTDHLIRARFDPTYDITLPLSTDDGLESQVVFSTTAYPSVTLVSATAAETDLWPTLVSGTSIKSEGDDNCPFTVWGGHVGANHGWASAWQVTMAGHGKDATDLGSTWSDGARVYTLVDIVSASIVLVVGDYSVVGGIVIGVTTAPAAPLTHVAGATHLADITIVGGVVEDQLHPSSHSHVVTVLLDGSVVADGRSYGEVLTIAESYTIVSFKAFVDWSRANIGVDPLANVASMTAYGYVDNVYRISAGGQVIVSQKFRAAEKAQIGVGVTQVAALSRSGTDIREQFMPGAGVAGGVDWGTLVDVSAAGVDANFTPTECVSASDPVNRFVQFMKDAGGTYKWGLVVGYLPYGGSSIANRIANAAGQYWQVRGSTRKNYPQVTYAQTLNIGDSAEGMAYRKYLPAAALPVANLTIDDGSCQYVIINNIATTTGTQMAAPTFTGRRLAPVGIPSITAPERVAADGLRYVVAVSPGYGMWQAVPAEAGRQVPVPAAATDPGSPGDWAADATHVYFCVAADSWCRASIAAWP